MDNLNLASVPEEFRDDLEKAVVLLREGGAESVFLFGSLAQGLACEGSDLDLAITGIEASAFYSLYSRTARQLKHNLDLVDLDHEVDFSAFLRANNRLVQIA